MEDTNPADTLSSEQTGDVGRTEPKRPDKSLGDLFSAMTEDLSTLFHKEVELAKLEAKDEAAQFGSAAGMFAGAGVAALLTLTLISFALAWWIAEAINTALSFLIVGALWGVAAVVLTSVARRKLKNVEVVPQTIQTIKEDLQWAKAQKP